MSGDVQPRKRKDKRRKKADEDYHIQRIRGTSFDEDDVGTPPPTLVNPSSDILMDNVTIHVHKEGGTGGHWCARIIFFALLSVLVGLVGIIIFEYRGSTDVDTPISDSRWAMIFDGWVDDIIPQHDEEPHGEASEENGEHDEEETEEDEKGDYEEKEQEEEEEEEEEEETEESEADKDSPEVDKEEDEGIGLEEGEEEAEEEEEEKEEEADEEETGSKPDGLDDEEDQQSVEEAIIQKNVYVPRREVTRNRRSFESREVKMTKNDEGFDEDNSVENDDDFGTLEELENVSEEDITADETTNDSEENVEEEDEEEDENDDGEQEEDAEEEDKADNNDLDISIGDERASREDDEDNISQEYFSIPGVGEIDENSVEPLEEIEESDLEEVANELDIEPDEEPEIEEETSSVAVKFGVGVALIVAAHFVLVRRWKNVENDLTGGSYDTEAVDLARRNTIVPPLNPKDLISKNEDRSVIKDERIAEAYEQLGEKYKSLETENWTGSPKGKLESLQVRHVSMQEKTFRKGTPAKIDARSSKKEEEMEETMTSESERQSATEADEEDEEVSEEEEEEEEEDEEEELEDEEIEEPDDSELVAKLEAKYGKLPSPTESEDEEDYEDEEEEDEEEEEELDEEDADIQGWKRVKAPKGPQSGGPAVEQRREVRDKGPSPRSTSGSQLADKNVHDSVNESSLDEVSIQEEINYWLSKEFDN